MISWTTPRSTGSASDLLRRSLAEAAGGVVPDLVPDRVVGAVAVGLGAGPGVGVALGAGAAAVDVTARASPAAAARASPAAAPAAPHLAAPSRGHAPGHALSRGLAATPHLLL